MKYLALFALFGAVAATAHSSVPPVDLLAALRLREQIAAEITTGKSSAAAALARLRAPGTMPSVVGDREEDFALAAGDIGRRLLATEKPAEAEEFFRAAEVALTAALAKAQGKERARPLAARALLRARFLGDPDGGKKDIAEALEIAPEDDGLKATAHNVARGHGQKKPAPPVQFTSKPWERGN